MLVETFLYQFLKGNSALFALVGSAIYPERAPQKQPLPFIRFHLISESPLHSQDNNAYSLQSYSFQISIFAASYLKAAEIREALKDALNGISGQHYLGSPVVTYTASALHTNTFSQYEEDNECFHIALDFDIWFST